MYGFRLEDGSELLLETGDIFLLQYEYVADGGSLVAGLSDNSKEISLDSLRRGGGVRLAGTSEVEIPHVILATYHFSIGDNIAIFDTNQNKYIETTVLDVIFIGSEVRYRTDYGVFAENSITAPETGVDRNRMKLTQKVNQLRYILNRRNNQ